LQVDACRKGGKSGLRDGRNPAQFWRPRRNFSLFRACLRPTRKYVWHDILRGQSQRLQLPGMRRSLQAHTLTFKEPMNLDKHLDNPILRFQCPKASRLILPLLLGFLGTYAAHAQTYSVIHSFTGQPDGAVPESGLIRDADGNLYGTTYEGGAY